MRSQEDVQLEFTMLDPHVRLPIKHDGKGHFFLRFKVSGGQWQPGCLCWIRLSTWQLGTPLWLKRTPPILNAVSLGWTRQGEDMTSGLKEVQVPPGWRAACTPPAHACPLRP